LYTQLILNPAYNSNIVNWKVSRDFFSQGVAETQPEWRMMDQFWSDVTQPALALDALATSHPVSVPVNDPKVQ
jgi:hypothetical protein